MDLEGQIKAQGELVRKLKAAKEDKARIQEEVAKLLELKAQIGDTNNVQQKFTVKNPKGSRDFSPDQMALRSYVLNIVESIFEINGAKTIDTPLFEFKEVLTEKYGEDSKLIYDLEEYDGEVLSLRYDLTVPFARYLGKSNIKNFKRYQIAPVYRRDNPSIARGRFREFYQCDFDIAGSYESMKPDAECIKIVYEILNVLDLRPFVIKINHRSLLDGMLEVCGVPSEKFRCICSAIDKLDKSPWAEVKTEMIEEKGLTEEVADKIGKYVCLNGGEQLVDQLLQNQELVKSKSAVAGLEAIKILLKFCESQGTLDCVSFDLSLARGLDYYTGVIYEAILSKKDGQSDEIPVGSVAGGGRYDNLVGMFNPNNETVPCVGVSIGIERIFTVLEAQFAASKKKLRTTEVSVYVATAQKNLFNEKIKLYTDLSEKDFKVGFSYKKNPKLLAQLQHCEECDIPFAVILGESEIQRGVVKLREVSTRNEVEISRENLASELRSRLKDIDTTKNEVEKLTKLRAELKNSGIVTTNFTNETPKGTIDFSQEQMALRKYIIRAVSLSFKKHGAESISTPVFELQEVLRGKYGVDSKRIYDLKDQGGEKLSLRYDLTVPFARYLAMNKKMSMVCSQIGKVYRRDNPSIEKGVYREFYQGDFDMVGSYDPMIPEANCISIMYETLNSLGLPDFIIKVNHKVLLDAILAVCGVPSDKIKSVCNTLADLDLLPWMTVGRKLIKENGLKEEVAEKIGKYARQYGDNNVVSYLKRDEELMKNKQAVAALSEIELLLEYCTLFGIARFVCFDLGLSRRLDYYTGVVFEAALIGEDYDVRDETSIGPLAGGGRYDNLVGMFDSKKKSVPCVGFSIGIDRVFSVLQSCLSASKE